MTIPKTGSKISVPNLGIDYYKQEKNTWKKRKNVEEEKNYHCLDRACRRCDFSRRFVIVSFLTKDTHDEITGKWAIVFRYTDNKGNDLHEFVSDEYLEITADSFVYYKMKGTEAEKVSENKWKFEYGTSAGGDARVRELNRYSSCYIPIPDVSDDLGVFFYGPNCIALGSYHRSTALYMVLIRCDEIGKHPTISSNDSGWTDPDGNSKTIDKERRITAVFDSAASYSVKMNIRMTKHNDGSTSVENQAPKLVFES